MNQECYDMNCSVSSIAETCLQLDPLWAKMKQLWGPDNCQNRINQVLVPLWLEELLQSGYPDDGVMNTLKTILKDGMFLNCTIPGSSGMIECVNC